MLPNITSAIESANDKQTRKEMLHTFHQTNAFLVFTGYTSKIGILSSTCTNPRRIHCADSETKRVLNPSRAAGTCNETRIVYLSPVCVYVRREYRKYIMMSHLFLARVQYVYIRKHQPQTNTEEVARRAQVYRVVSLEGDLGPGAKASLTDKTL